MTPKSLLRHPKAVSRLDEIISPSCFQRIIPSKTLPSADIKDIILCTGKIYYELAKERELRKMTEKLPIIHVEQISPFPYDLLIKEFDKYPNASLKWVQEEPKNMGYWSYVHPRLMTATANTRIIKYVGRNTSSSTATGNKYINLEEQAMLVEKAFE